VTRAEVTFRVRDEGLGFDPAALPDPAEAANLERAEGRGLALIRAFLDGVRHNAAGNEVSLVKRADSRGSLFASGAFHVPGRRPRDLTRPTS